MTESEIAWSVREYIGGRTQAEIAAELGTSASTLCTLMRAFCDQWSGADVEALMVYNDERRFYLQRALWMYTVFGGRIRKPDRDDHNNAPSTWARAEHAWLLRAEGWTFREIGARVGVTGWRAQMLVRQFAAKMRWAMRRTRFRWEGNEAP